ncbi:MAG: SET domain-containing protein [Candidatus Pacebacteria bacterium]|nr:SET domain-containing protein [Candidatus Paceibacterota bacterium]
MTNLSWLNPKLTVKKSPVDKKGVFARKPIKKGEILVVFGGLVVKEEEYAGLKKGKFKKAESYGLGIEDGFYLITDREGKLEKADYFNHSCNPNAGIKGQITLVAMKDIKSGEEVTFDYTTTECNKYRFRCYCRTKNCRGTITGDDWQKPELQRKYKGYFSYYIQEKINKLKKRA